MCAKWVKCWFFLLLVASRKRAASVVSATVLAHDISFLRSHARDAYSHSPSKTTAASNDANFFTVIACSCSTSWNAFEHKFQSDCRSLYWPFTTIQPWKKHGIWIKTLLHTTFCLLYSITQYRALSLSRRVHSHSPRLTISLSNRALRTHTHAGEHRHITHATIYYSIFQLLVLHNEIETIFLFLFEPFAWKFADERSTCASSVKWHR